MPYAENLIHRTEKGHLVRSKSELVIANMLFQSSIDYDYERVLEGEAEAGRLRPDFSFVTPDGDLIVWEHLGMLHREDYRRGWEWKLRWYEANGFALGRNLLPPSMMSAGARLIYIEGYDCAGAGGIGLNLSQQSWASRARWCNWGYCF